MRILVSAARWITFASAVIIILSSTGFGALIAEFELHQWSIGAIVGGVFGLLFAGCALGVYAALFVIVENTESTASITAQILSLLKTADLRQQRFDLLATDIANCSERSASALEKMKKLIDIQKQESDLTTVKQISAE